MARGSSRDGRDDEDAIIHAKQDYSCLTGMIIETTVLLYTVIQSFADKSTEALWHGRRPADFLSSILKVSLRKLTQLEAASSLEELKFPPGNRLERLKGNRAGQHSIRVNDQYRVCFRWIDHTAHDVEIIDYH